MRVRDLIKRLEELAREHGEDIEVDVSQLTWSFDDAADVVEVTTIDDYPARQFVSTKDEGTKAKKRRKS